MKNKIKNKIKNTLINLIMFCRFIKSEPWFLVKILKLKSSKPKIVLLGTPIHGNIGDHLIAESEKEYFEEEFKEFQYVECTMPFSKYFLKYIVKNTTQKDIVVVSGGGWLGSEWKENEIFVRRIIKNFGKCNLAIFPQTVHYIDLNSFAEDGARIYSKKKDLLFCVRDENSYNFLIDNNFCANGEVFLMPDFALRYKSTIQHKNNSIRIKTCFRDDIELSIDNKAKNKIFQYIKKYDPKPECITTNTKGIVIKPKNRKKAIDSKIAEIAESRLLITDRLHAMVMAAISGTPCIAFDNSTHKVSGVYKWFQNLDYIHIYNLNENIEDVINMMLSKSFRTHYKLEIYDSYFKELKDKLMRMKGDINERNYP